MKLAVINNQGKSVKELVMADVSEVSDAVVTDTVRFIQNSLRQPVAHTKDRGAVSGGGIKPWKQKGTGRARAGSSRSPLWRGGGVTFGPLSINSFATRLPKKVRQLASLKAWYQQIDHSNVIAIENYPTFTKTKEAVSWLKSIGIDGVKTLVVLPEKAEIALSLSNIPFVKIVFGQHFNIIDVMSARKIVIDSEIIKSILPLEEAKSKKIVEDTTAVTPSDEVKSKSKAKHE
ncbi:MAG: 50S ribosomal protein L4 [Patescibacteria group bacterium]|jgi:large subunit ribosomal protein L4